MDPNKKTLSLKRVFMSVGSSVLPLLVFLAGNSFFIFLDLTGKPAALLKYRVQEEKTVPVSCTQDCSHVAKLFVYLTMT